MIIGGTYTVFIRSMAVFTALGFIASYELFTAMGDQLLGAIVCLVLDTSPKVFAFSTRLVLSDEPYFLTSMLALLLAVRLEKERNICEQVVLAVLCGLSIVVSILIRSSSIALLLGICAWLVVSWFAKRQIARSRLKTFLPIVLVGLSVQIVWMEWGAKHEVIQWPMVGGYPQSYISQLEMKNGNNPELGKASWRDVPLRVEKNLNDRAIALTQLITRKEYIYSAWVSPFVFVPVLLIVVGVGWSISHGGGGLSEWYFIMHESMYLLWPWNFELRFFLPVAPLAFLYLWRGGKALTGFLSGLRRQAVAGCICVLSSILAVDAGVFAWKSRTVQPELTAVFWVVLVIASAYVACTGLYRYPDPLAAVVVWWERRVAIGGRRLTIGRLGGVLTLAVLLLVGTVEEISLGEENLKFDLSKHPSYYDVRAGEWIRGHTPTSAVVMARQLDVVYHYSGRRVIWFPPVRDPQLLMQGIHKYNIEFIVVNEREYSYWLPPEQDSLQPLLHAYPGGFQLVYHEPRLSIYAVIPDFT
jgi:hypothetical protein